MILTTLTVTRKSRNPEVKGSKPLQRGVNLLWREKKNVFADLFFITDQSKFPTKNILLKIYSSVLNPLSPKSDLHQHSPHHINVL